MFERNYSLCPSLSVVSSLRDVPKTVFCWNQNGGHKLPLGGAQTPHSDGTGFDRTGIIDPVSSRFGDRCFIH